MTQGGKREGAGRKPRFGADKTVAMRVPEPLKPLLDQWLADYRSLRTIQSSQAEDFRTLGQSLSALSLPLFASRVPAGAPVPADDLREADIDLNTLLVRRPEATFMVTVKGESMRDAAILDGDMLLVDRSIEPKNGKIVVAVLNGELTVKRLEKTSAGIRLLPENPDYSPIEVPEDANFFIWGVVTRVIHKVE
ncbi:MAG: translesion error-prone DNA polymerase V autoproteolytic subunit [Paludibacterium sp.]|uniref:LexA family protein n=1 Tax=Paludibacterium sp. TaxID=1917523 RepID=UPI0025CFA076|nr:translesion error-prone DNA polymerase V autoproteolytic subunit [Paludibacterium sp.]MBV8047468.1 translesion error-prone DNA polymerase V autoproteolytic subunit [Paludibacterium sp.]MBV8646734.1 translesion error-prone DNA polymerase V autoproteolytic subunit [Paludibacterium sp.]